ncbi:LysR family transcriptional regulator [Aquisalimonas lutea]|uniref:LysR family transcriptional regulator n=1 Tax=Aquisalimonas lutea TaxID=1327750 RepID=UPI0025B3372B|nr:LysR family transcriptional regulator [Aquisalimonas lutea]MDN3519159.1 LysR family transcriptional regulator [Aquisalimonas lutea]
MPSISHLRSLVAIADTGSFSEAARALGIAQSTISQHVARLEHALGTRLIHRGGVVRLTATGTYVCRQARGIRRLHDRILAARTRPPLAIGASSNIGTYLLEPVMRRLGQACGADALNMRVASNPAIADALDAGEIDIGLMEWWDGRPGFRARKWRDEELVVIVPRNHRWSGRDCIRPADLADVPLIGGESGSGTGRLLKEYLASSGIEPRVGLTLGNTEAVKRAVINGLGTSIVLAGTVADEVRRGELHALPLAGGGVRKALQIVHPEELADEPRKNEFVDLLHEHG